MGTASIVGALNGGSIVAIDHTPFMRLCYGAIIKRPTATYTGVGSLSAGFLTLKGVKPCDLSPVSDTIANQQSGQQSTLTHIIHFQAGTDVQDRDEVEIVYAPQPGNFGNVGDTYIILSVLEPSEDLAYIRCRAFKGKVPSA